MLFKTLMKQVFFPFLILQCSSQSDPNSANQQVQLLLEEKQQLETHNHQVTCDIIVPGFADTNLKMWFIRIFCVIKQFCNCSNYFSSFDFAV